MQKGGKQLLKSKVNGAYLLHPAFPSLDATKLSLIYESCSIPMPLHYLWFAQFHMACMDRVPYVTEA